MLFFVKIKIFEPINKKTGNTYISLRKTLRIVGLSKYA